MCPIELISITYAQAGCEALHGDALEGRGQTGQQWCSGWDARGGGERVEGALATEDADDMPRVLPCGEHLAHVAGVCALGSESLCLPFP